MVGLAMLACAAGGCTSGSGSPAVQAGPASPSVSTGRTTAAPAPSASTTTSPATDYLLAQQIAVLAAGDGAVPNCTADLARIPGLGTTPAVWIGSISGKNRVTTPDEVALCLSGFAPDQAVKVTVTAGTRQYVTSAEPAPGNLTYQHLEPSDSLFTGQALQVHAQGNGVLQSEKWWFVPIAAAREDLAAAGTLTIRATQGPLSAAHSQPVELPTLPNRLTVDTGSHQVLIYGFEPGKKVPVGLYKVDQQTQQAALVRQIGTVVMPRSRTVVFTVPDTVVSEVGSQASYCVTVPLEQQYNCPQP